MIKKRRRIRKTTEGQLAYTKRRQAQAEEQGLCRRCCTRKKTPGMTSCFKCRTRASGYGAARKAEGKCGSCSNLARVGAQTCAECHRKRIEGYAQLKAEVFTAYGMKCVCCGANHLDFLAIDHIDGKGAAHRKKLFGKRYKSGTGVHFYRWLKANRYPQGFQVMCHNCNFSKHLSGVCVHGEA